MIELEDLRLAFPARCFRQTSAVIDLAPRSEV